MDFDLEKFLAHDNARFISYRELMETLANAFSQPLKMVARVLRKDALYEEYCAWRLHDDIRPESGGRYISILLQHTFLNDSIEVVHIPDESCNADPETFGWFRGDIVHRLQLAGLKLPASLVDSVPEANKRTDELQKLRDQKVELERRLETALDEIHSLQSVAMAPEKSDRGIAFDQPLSVGESQSRAILQALTILGYSHLELPPVRGGTSGAKADVWDLVCNERKIFKSRKTYETAWDKLRSEKTIKDQQ